MTPQDAIQKLSRHNPSDGVDTGSVNALAEAVASTSEYGYGPYDGALEDWLASGDFDGSETVESVAAEWDADRD